MFNLISRGILVVFFALAVVIAPAYGEEEKKADPEINQSTGEIECCTQEIEAECEEEYDEVEVVETEIDKSTVNEVGDVKVYNYGIQAIFINSKVTVNGGTISGEMTKTTGAAAPSAKPGAKPAANGAPSKPANGEKPKKPGKFDELIKNATKDAGLFTVYTRKDDKIYWEVKTDQIDKDFLVSGKLATGLGAGRIKPGAYLGSLIVHFRKIDDKLQLMQKNSRFTASEGSKTEAALKKNYQDSIVASFPIEATNPEDSGCMIEMSKFLLSDLFNLSPDVNRSLSGAYGFDRGESYVKESKVFPENIVVRTSYAFRSSNSGGSVTVPSPGSAQLDVLLDVRQLKDNPDFQPRIADQRIGHFVDAQFDFSNKERTSPFNLMINKWDIRKASPDLEMSPPVKPIVIWIENTVPEKYRKPIRDGLLEWNKAFAKIGIKDALVVKQQPDDAEWDIADARYNTIHWNESYDMAYSGVSQWISDPRTGEILQGNFLLEADSIRNLLAFRQYREPDRMNLEKMRQSNAIPSDCMRMQDNYQQAKAGNAMIGLTVMAARAGIENVTGEELDDFIYQYLFSVVCHEFGHVLGLRHNFEASTMLPIDQVHNKELTARKSFSSSIMDYTPVNIAPEGVEQGFYFEPTIGPYDYLAIEYAYKEIKPATGETEKDLLNAIAEKEETAELTYGTDEDLYSMSPYSGPGIDPLCNQFDLGRDPLNYAKQQTQLVLDTIPKLPKLVKDGDSYLMVRNAFSRLLNYYFESADFAIKYLGGQYVNRVKKGGENDRPPLEPVSAARQREAVNFLVETIFADDLFEVNPKILNMLAAEKWYHWGASWPGPSSEYPLSVVVQNLYKSVLNQTFSPIVIRRILDAEKQRPEGEVDFTLPELFRRIKQGVWNEVYQGGKDASYTNDKPFISTYQRILQREHVKLMIEIMLEPSFGMPDDARTQAWRTLVDLQRQIKEIVEQFKSSSAIDDYSRDHLAESLEKINRALDARLSARVDLW